MIGVTLIGAAVRYNFAFEQFLTRSFGFPDGSVLGKGPDNDPPFYSCARMRWTGCVPGLRCVGARARWRDVEDYRRSSSMAFFMAWIWCMPGVVRTGLRRLVAMSACLMERRDPAACPLRAEQARNLPCGRVLSDAITAEVRGLIALRLGETGDVRICSAACHLGVADSLPGCPRFVDSSCLAASRLWTISFTAWQTPAQPSCARRGRHSCRCCIWWMSGVCSNWQRSSCLDVQQLLRERGRWASRSFCRWAEHSCCASRSIPVPPNPRCRRPPNPPFEAVERLPLRGTGSRWQCDGRRQTHPSYAKHAELFYARQIGGFSRLRCVVSE